MPLDWSPPVMALFAPMETSDLLVVNRPQMVEEGEMSVRHIIHLRPRRGGGTIITGRMGSVAIAVRGDRKRRGSRGGGGIVWTKPADKFDGGTHATDLRKLSDAPRFSGWAEVA
jgi:hypothetical protein